MHRHCFLLLLISCELGLIVTETLSSKFITKDWLFIETHFSMGEDMCRFDDVMMILGFIPYWKVYFNKGCAYDVDYHNPKLWSIWLDLNYDPIPDNNAMYRERIHGSSTYCSEWFEFGYNTLVQFVLNRSMNES